MKIILYIALLSPLSCAQKNTETLSSNPTEMTDTTASETQDPTFCKKKEDCPSGVKTPCNVPAMTEEEIAKSQEDEQQCFADCVQSRQAEAIAHDVIEAECQQSCMQEHFIGQVRVVPSAPDLKTDATEEKTEETTELQTEE